MSVQLRRTEESFRDTAPHAEQQYLGLLADIMTHGVQRGDRTGTGTLGVFGRQIRFDLSQGFPLLTTKKVRFNDIIVELLWFLRGDTNVRWLQERGCTIWDEWAVRTGTSGRSTGASGGPGRRRTAG